MLEPSDQPPLADICFTLLAECVRQPTLAKFVALHFALDGLEFSLLADRTGVDRSSPLPTVIAHVKCAASDCLSTWATPDACLLNFAPTGSPTPHWLCRAHHPSRKGLPFPGWTPPHAASLD